MALFRMKPRYRKRGGVKYVGTITGLSTARNSIGATFVGDYALFVGGYISGSPSVAVDVYNSSLTKINISNLINADARSNSDAINFNNYALIIGGEDGVNGNPFIDMLVYDTSLTLRRYNILDVLRSRIGVAAVGNYVIFAGGINRAYYDSQYNLVEGVDTSFTHINLSNLDRAKYSLKGGSVGNYALFAGGQYKDYQNYLRSTDIVEVYNNDLTKATSTTLSYAVSGETAVSLDNYALFTMDTQHHTIDAFDSYLTRINPEDLSEYNPARTAVKLKDYAIFGSNSVYNRNDTDVYDKSLVKTKVDPLSVTRGCDSAAVGNYALFAGGSYRTTYYDTVDVYEVT